MSTKLYLTWINATHHIIALVVSSNQIIHWYGYLYWIGTVEFNEKKHVFVCTDKHLLLESLGHIVLLYFVVSSCSHYIYQSNEIKYKTPSMILNRHFNRIEYCPKLNFHAFDVHSCTDSLCSHAKIDNRQLLAEYSFTNFELHYRLPLIGAHINYAYESYNSWWRYVSVCFWYNFQLLIFRQWNSYWHKAKWNVYTRGLIPAPAQTLNLWLGNTVFTMTKRTILCDCSTFKELFSSLHQFNLSIGDFLQKITPIIH